MTTTEHGTPDTTETTPETCIACGSPATSTVRAEDMEWSPVAASGAMCNACVYWFDTHIESDA